MFHEVASRRAPPLGRRFHSQSEEQQLRCISSDRAGAVNAGEREVRFTAHVQGWNQELISAYQEVVVR